MKVIYNLEIGLGPTSANMDVINHVNSGKEYEIETTVFPLSIITDLLKKYKTLEEKGDDNAKFILELDLQSLREYASDKNIFYKGDYTSMLKQIDKTFDFITISYCGLPKQSQVAIEDLLLTAKSKLSNSGRLVVYLPQIKDEDLYSTVQKSLGNNFTLTGCVFINRK